MIKIPQPPAHNSTFTASSERSIEANNQDLVEQYNGITIARMNTKNNEPDYTMPADEEEALNLAFHNIAMLTDPAERHARMDALMNAGDHDAVIALLKKWQPGGSGRKRDREAYEAEFTQHPQRQRPQRNSLRIATHASLQT